LDTRCPSCLSELAFRFLRTSIHRKVVRGNPSFFCPNCQAGLAQNVHPKEKYWSEVELLIILIPVVLPLTLLLSSFMTTGVALAVASILGLGGFVAYQIHLYKVVLASWPRYKTIDTQIIEQRTL
jgi:hypothetical protein